MSLPWICDDNTDGSSAAGILTIKFASFFGCDPHFFSALIHSFAKLREQLLHLKACVIAATQIKTQIKVNHHHRWTQLGVWLHNKIKIKMQVKVNHQQQPTQLGVW